MGTTKPYKELSINQKINYKSGWDIAFGHEGEKGGIYGKSKTRPYCKIAECMDREIPLKICVKDYNDSQKHRFFNGERGKSHCTKLFEGLPN